MDDEKDNRAVLAARRDGDRPHGREYGRLCRKISDDILSSREDSEVRRGYISCPVELHPAADRPASRAFIAAVTHNLSLKRLRSRAALKKRRSRSRAGGAGRNARLLRGGRARIRAPRAYAGDRRIPAHALGRRPEHFHLPLLALRADCGYCRAARLLAEQSDDLFVPHSAEGADLPRKRRN